MNCFKIDERIEQVEIKDFRNCPFQYILVLNPAEWAAKRDLFDMGIDLDVETSQIFNTRAEVNYDSLTGEFYIPDRNNLSNTGFRFAFALDEKGIVFIDDNDDALNFVKEVAGRRYLTVRPMRSSEASAGSGAICEISRSITRSFWTYAGNLKRTRTASSAKTTKDTSTSYAREWRLYTI